MASSTPPAPPVTDPVPPIIIAQAEAVAAANEPETLEPFPTTETELPQTSKAAENGETSKAPTGGAVSDARHDLLSPPPMYGEEVNQVQIKQDSLGIDTHAKVADDGRVNISINQKSRRLSNLLVPALRSQMNLHTTAEEAIQPPGYIPPSLGGLPGQVRPPPLNVVIQVVGSRGDVQPFVALGQVLKRDYGHRVRLATHPTFKGFIEENGLEFFSIGGDPAELMAFMVKNPGLMPGIESLKAGDVGKRRKGMAEIVRGCWRSCIEAGDGIGAQPFDDYATDSASVDSGISVSGDPSQKPFVADVIIANPPSFAHIHIAEKLGIPLHLMFTMPWSPTQSFPHPLANVTASNAEMSVTNFVSYALVDMLTWQGLGDVINRFREKSLGLEPISLIWAPGMMTRLRIPYTYCWSPALIPKPRDWGSYISISGFYFLSLASSYTPAPDLAAFLAAGEPPVYIGFGSIVVDDPNAMTKMVFEAVKQAGVRALVSKGWGGLGGDELGVPEGIFMLGNVPHDWLFPKVSCVVHHGGAGTTAAGISMGKPTVVVPFFGDQPFWGSMVAKAGAGPKPIAYKDLTAEDLAASIKDALRPEALDRAKDLGEKISKEKGADVGAKSFHDNLDVDSLRCMLAPSRPAVWRVKRTDVRLSALAATVLGNEGLLDFSDLKLYRPKEYDVEDGPWEPISGGASALMGTIGSLMMGIADFPVEVFNIVQSKSEEAKKLHRENSLSNEVKKDDLDSSSVTPPASESKISFDSGVEMSTEPLSTGSTSIGDKDLQSPISTNEDTSLKTVPTDLSVKSGSGSTTSIKPHRHHSLDHLHRAESGVKLSLDAAIGSGKAASRIVGTALKSPMDFSLSLARGFHNAPKLYGDETVRDPDKVTGIQSGLKAAGKGFTLGLYDGISGLYTQPVDGAKAEGPAGFVKGIGKGIGGLILKPQAAIWALPGYTFKGIYKEIQKHFGSSVQNYIIAARTAQGYEDWKTSTPEERLDIVGRWHDKQVEIHEKKISMPDFGCTKSSKTSGSKPDDPPHGFLATRHMSFDERKRLAAEKREKKVQEKKKSKNKRPSLGPRAASVLQSSANRDQDAETAEFEKAIQTSVAATSRGDPKEDAIIESAIRASVKELRSARDSNASEAEVLQRAIQASVSASGLSRASSVSQNETNPAEPTKKRALAAALEQSMHYRQGSESDWDSVADTDEDDEDFRKAVEASKETHSSAQQQQQHPHHHHHHHHHHASATATAPANDADADDAELQKAIEESKKSHYQGGTQTPLLGGRTEEDIVLEYVKKQSLAEEEHRRLMAAKAQDAGEKLTPEEQAKLGEHPVAEEGLKVEGVPKSGAVESVEGGKGSVEKEVAEKEG